MESMESMENMVSIDYLKSFNPKAVIYNRLIQQEENRCQELTIVDEEGEYENIIKDLIAEGQHINVIKTKPV
jgi:hypothetical protein